MRIDSLQEKVGSSLDATCFFGRWLNRPKARPQQTGQDGNSSLRSPVIAFGKESPIFRLVRRRPLSCCGVFHRPPVFRPNSRMVLLAFIFSVVFLLSNKTSCFSLDARETGFNNSLSALGVSFTSTNVFVSEHSKTATISVSVTGGDNSTFWRGSVDYSIREGTALQGRDYEAARGNIELGEVLAAFRIRVSN